MNGKTRLVDVAKTGLMDLLDPKAQGIAQDMAGFAQSQANNLQVLQNPTRPRPVDAGFVGGGQGRAQQVQDFVRQFGGQPQAPQQAPQPQNILRDSEGRPVTSSSGEPVRTTDFRQVIGQRAQQLMQDVDPEKAKNQDPAQVQNGAFAVAAAEGSNTLANEADQGAVQSTLKKAFGNEEMWLTLAMGFNGMRMRPDATLGAALADRLKTIQINKKARSNAPAIAAQLKKMGYDNMAQYVLANPQHAEKIYEKALGADLKAPTQFEQLKELAKTPEGRAQIKEWKELGVIGGQTINVGGSAGEKLAVADVQPIYQAAFQAPKNIQALDETIDLIKTKDINVGVLSDWKNLRDKVLTTFGDEAAEGRLTWSQLLKSSLGAEVFALQKALGLGARGMDTPAEREFMIEALTGSLALTKDALIGMAKRRRNAAVQSIKDYEREKDSPAMKSYASQRSPITYTSKDFERKPEASKFKQRIRYDAQGNRI